MKTTKTKPIPEGTANITFNAPEELRDELNAEAERLGVSRSELLRAMVHARVAKDVNSDLSNLREAETAKEFLEVAARFARAASTPKAPRGPRK